MGVIPNPKMAFIFPISCILALIFPILLKYFPKCVGKGSFPKSQIKSLLIDCLDFYFMRREELVDRCQWKWVGYCFFAAAARLVSHGK